MNSVQSGSGSARPVDREEAARLLAAAVLIARKAGHRRVGTRDAGR